MKLLASILILMLLPLVAEAEYMGEYCGNWVQQDPNQCFADFETFNEFAEDYANQDPDADLNLDGVVDMRDLLRILSGWSSWCRCCDNCEICSNCGIQKTSLGCSVDIDIDCPYPLLIGTVYPGDLVYIDVEVPKETFYLYQNPSGYDFPHGDLPYHDDVNCVWHMKECDFDTSNVFIQLNHRSVTVYWGYWNWIQEERQEVVVAHIVDNEDKVNNCTGVKVYEGWNGLWWPCYATVTVRWCQELSFWR